ECWTWAASYALLLPPLGMSVEAGRVHGSNVDGCHAREFICRHMNPPPGFRRRKHTTIAVSRSPGMSRRGASDPRMTIAPAGNEVARPRPDPRLDPQTTTRRST